MDTYTPLVPQYGPVRTSLVVVKAYGPIQPRLRVA